MSNVTEIEKYWRNRLDDALNSGKKLSDFVGLYIRSAFVILCGALILKELNPAQGMVYRILLGGLLPALFFVWLSLFRYSSDIIFIYFVSDEAMHNNMTMVRIVKFLAYACSFCYSVAMGLVIARMVLGNPLIVR